MNEKTEDLIIKICNEQNYDAILRQLIKSDEENSIEKILNEINNNKDIPKKQKQGIYEAVFDYINRANDKLIKNIKEIFKKGVEEGLKNNKIRNTIL